MHRERRGDAQGKKITRGSIPVMTTKEGGDGEELKGYSKFSVEKIPERENRKGEQTWR